MAFTTKTWFNREQNLTTKLDAAGLNDLEGRISSAVGTADSAIAALEQSVDGLKTTLSVHAAPLYRFVDDFEAGNFSKWSSTNVSGPAAVATVRAASARRGGFGARLVNDATAASFANVRRTHAAVNDLSASGWFRWTADTGATGNNGTGLRFLTPALVRVVDIHREDFTGNILVRTRKADDTFAFSASLGTVALNVWVKLALRAVYNGAGAVSRIVAAVNDVPQLDGSAYDLSGGGWTITQLGTEHPQVFAVDVDDVTVSA